MVQSQLTDVQKYMLRSLVPGLRDGSVKTRWGISLNNNKIQRISGITGFSHDPRLWRYVWSEAKLSDFESFIQCGFFEEKRYGTWQSERSKDYILHKQLIIDASESDFGEPTTPNIVSKPAEALRIFEDFSKQFLTQEYDTTSATSHLDRLRTSIDRVFGSSSAYLLDLRLVKFRYPRIKGDKAINYFNTDKSYVLAVIDKILDELRMIQLGIVTSNQTTPILPPEIQASLKLFRSNHPNTLKTAFIMMSFDKTPEHIEIASAIKQTLAASGITGLRADDREYHPDLFSNILTYMHGCDFGIAVFDSLSVKMHNPNVSLEVGYMLALGKRVCFLKDKTLNSLPVDLIGKLYRDFDPGNITETIQPTLSRWLAAHVT